MEIDENINKTPKKLRILIAPLDWGLGHATRCIPLIRLLYSQNADVMIGASGATANLLKNEFPEIVILPLKGYEIQYSRAGKSFFMKILLQVPKIMAAIKYEKKWLNDTLEQNSIDAVIADNRFGLYHPSLPCVFITHQLGIKTGTKILDFIVQKLNYSHINHFNECWVPDNEKSDMLAGKLSHPRRLPVIPVKHIGILTRCKKISSGKKFSVAIVLSGPEPQRTIFENKLIDEFKDHRLPFLLVRGLPGNAKIAAVNNPNITVYNHLPSAELNEAIQQSSIVIARSGYSTIMDLAMLRQKAILVPTPGQKEQEYLAAYAHEKKMFYTISQEKFSLPVVLNETANYPFIFPGTTRMNEQIVIDWLKSLKH